MPVLMKCRLHVQPVDTLEALGNEKTSGKSAHSGEIPSLNSHRYILKT